jgi:hypothetical protein
MKSHGQTPEEAIRIEAFILSEKAGHPAGMETYFWREAELIVAGRGAGGEKSGAPKRLSAKAKPKAAAAAKPAAAAKKTPKKKA